MATTLMDNDVNALETMIDASSLSQVLDAIGDIPKDLPAYLKIEVDYDALKMDYTEVDFDGETYLYR